MLSLGIALGGASKAHPVAVATVVPPPPQAAPTAPASSATPGPPDGDPVPAPRNCVARVTTKPAGAAVFWGDTALGSSPIRNAPVPCGTATVTLRRAHFEEVTRTITGDRDRDHDRQRAIAPPVRQADGDVLAAARVHPAEQARHRTDAARDRHPALRARSHRGFAAGLPAMAEDAVCEGRGVGIDVKLVRAPAPIALRAPAPTTAPTHAMPRSTGAAGPLAAR